MHKDKTMILQSDGQSKRQMEEIIYLSGPMSGIPKFNFPAFYEAELWITEHMMCSIINPARNVQGLSYDDYMNIDLYLMKLATTIVQLPGWEKSKGAKREYKYAILRGMKIIEYQDMKRCAEAGVLDESTVNSVRIQACSIARITKAWSDIEDFKQEIYLAIMMAKNGYNQKKSSYRTYVARIIENKKRDIIRRYQAGKNRSVRFAEKGEVG